MKCWLLRVISKRKIIWLKGLFFIRVIDETLNLAHTYLRMQWRTQGYVVLGRNCLLINFNENYFVTFDEKYCLPKTGERRERLHHIEWIFTYQHSREKVANSLSHMWTRYCFALSRDKIYFSWKRIFDRIAARKEFDVLDVFFGWLTNVQTVG